MKNIFKIQALLLFIMLVLLSTKTEAGTYSLKENRSLRKRNKRGKLSCQSKRKAKKRKHKKRGKSYRNDRSVVEIKNITEAEVEEAQEKTVMKFDPQVVYKEGLDYINSEEGDTECDDAIVIGNYYLAIPSNLEKEEAELIMAKMSHLSMIAMSAATYDQFNLGAIAAVLDKSDYIEVKNNNQDIVTEKIKESDFHSLMAKQEAVEFARKAIILELKVALENKKKSFFKKLTSAFTRKTVPENIKLFANRNHIFNKIDFLEELKIEIDPETELNEKTVYLIAATAYWLNKNPELSFLKSSLFEGIIHAITIPFNLKKIHGSEELEIDYIMHREYRKLFHDECLKLYDIKSVDGIEESNSAAFLLESTAWFTWRKVAAGVGIAAALGLGSRAGYHVYKGPKDISKWDRLKAGYGSDKDEIVDGAKYVGNKTVDGAKYVGNKTVDGAKYVGNKTVDGAKYVGNKTVDGAKYVKDKAAKLYSGKAKAAEEKPVVVEE